MQRRPKVKHRLRQKHDVWSEFGTQCKKKDVEFGLVVDEIKNGADIKTLTEEHPELVIKNRKAVVDTISMFGVKSKHPLTDAEFAKRTPNLFQQGLIDHCEKMMSKYEDRKVIWIADPKGCTGKSSLVKFLKYKFGEENVIELGQGMTKDITYAWNGQRICVFDFSRTLEERINYNAIEAIKRESYFQQNTNQLKMVRSTNSHMLRKLRTRRKHNDKRWGTLGGILHLIAASYHSEWWTGLKYHCLDPRHQGSPLLVDEKKE